MNRYIISSLLGGALLFTGPFSMAQPGWQQQVKYKMDVALDVRTHKLTGSQRLEYTNHSPDTLRQLFYHLYWNAFQPNSMMDMRSRVLGSKAINGQPDWDRRVRDRIAHLTDTGIGYQKVLSLRMDGRPLQYRVEETILQVSLSEPILPGKTAVLEMEFEAQVPEQIRRAGRHAANGVDYSMSQWYPKICAYDRDGWHPNPYVAREFYGVWGDYDVKIRIDRRYILGGTGYLQNAQQIGYGYEAKGTKVQRPAGDLLTWHFVAPRVHDFVWAADPEYKHIVRPLKNGPTIHVLYVSGDPKDWKEVADAAEAVYPFIREKFGAYPYKQYSFIQGGDGGMEYPMATLLNGPGLGTVFHEWMHSWYQGLLATNESRHAWMDEGFTEWATNLIQHHYRETVIRKRSAGQPAALRTLDSLAALLPAYHAENYEGYLYLARSGYEEPLTTHADHFQTNLGYSLGSYSKGCVYLAQLGYIIGEENLHRTMLRYYEAWKYRHPGPDDFLRVAEKVSGLQLDWYNEYFVNSTKTINYGIDSLWEAGGQTHIRLRNLGQMPMPMDVLLEFEDGSEQLAYIPTYQMFGAKPVEDQRTRLVFPAWKWTHPTYTFQIDKPIRSLKALEIDPSHRMADIDRRNNRLVLPW